jgi:drug/metabolite transporter (DMT)-like permease
LLLVVVKPTLLPQNGYFQIKKVVNPVVLMSVIIFAAVWTGFLGLQYTNPLISALISLVTPILTILFGVLFYKDKWSYFSLLALLLIISGVYLINLEIA